jgi:predicted CXXCH cytochrome family protein
MRDALRGVPLWFLCLALAPGWGMAEDPPATVGEQVCAGCHAEKAAEFGFNLHARLKPFELRGHASRCEACHGPGEKHVSGGGDKQAITTFRDKHQAGASRACLACHSDGKAAEWTGGEHAMAGLTCSSCHVVHQSRRVAGPSPTATALLATRPGKANAPPPSAALAKPESELCVECHRDMRARMNYSSHHPVREGRMRCSSCHSVHGANEKLLASAEGTNALCVNCHTAKQGPFVFEHAAVEEGCNTCHEPHGTVAKNLLKQNEPFLCLQCHEAHFHIGRSGVSATVSTATGSSTNPWGESGWRRAFASKCTQCHTQIHGTDLPSQSISSGGKALIR